MEYLIGEMVEEFVDELIQKQLIERSRENERQIREKSIKVSKMVTINE
jgi:hypothetical protein